MAVGEISLQPGQDLILFRQNNGGDQHNAPVRSLELLSQTAVIPAHSLSAVFFFDRELDVNRRYIAIGESKVFPGVQLYEVVLSGRIDVLRRPRNAHVTSKSPLEAEDFDYYSRAYGIVRPLWKFQREIYPDIDQASRQKLHAFTKANNLQTASEANLITIISYYNELIRGGETLARY